MKASFPVRLADYAIAEPRYLGVGVKDTVQSDLQRNAQGGSAVKTFLFLWPRLLSRQRRGPNRCFSPNSTRAARRVTTRRPVAVC